MKVLLIYLTFFTLFSLLRSTQALSREAIERKLKYASSSLPQQDAINKKAKAASNKQAQKLKQDIRNAKRQNKKDIRKVKKNNGEL